MNDGELQKIIYALTVKSRPHNRERWIASGFRKINRRPGALFSYWKKKLEEGDPGDLLLFSETLGEYKNHTHEPKPMR